MWSVIKVVLREGTVTWGQTKGGTCEGSYVGPVRCKRTCRMLNVGTGKTCPRIVVLLDLGKALNHKSLSFLAFRAGAIEIPVTWDGSEEEMIKFLANGAFSVNVCKCMGYCWDQHDSQGQEAPGVSRAAVLCLFFLLSLVLGMELMPHSCQTSLCPRATPRTPEHLLLARTK